MKPLKQTNSQSEDSFTYNHVYPDNKIAIRKKETEAGGRVSTGKVFVARESLLTELLQTPHFRTLHNICIVIFIILFLNTLIYDLVDSGSINVGTGLIRIAFEKMDTVLYVWSCMQAAALLPYPLLKLWAAYHQRFILTGKAVHVWDTAWLCTFVAFQVTFIVLPISAILGYNLPIACTVIIVLEMIRFIMKTHAYVRSVCPRALHQPSASSSAQLQPIIPLPPFSCYLYFLFAPTLIYRDSYPRTKHIRWGVVAARLLEIVVIIFFVSFLCQLFIIPNFSKFGKAGEVLEAKRLVLIVFGSLLPSLMTHILAFYLMLHCWLNAAAEVLTFADRQFYTDWWNQTNYISYYRTWNWVIRDWLYTYIYRDIFILTGSRHISTMVVFIVSAIFHEVIVGVTLRFFYPVVLVTFGIIGLLLGLLMSRSESLIGNIFLWWTLAVGNGVMYCMYSAEYFARKNCPLSGEVGVWDVLTPRSWSCHQIVLRPDWQL